MDRNEPPNRTLRGERIHPNVVRQGDVVGDPAEDEDSRYVMEHYPELAQLYPFSWIAVRDRAVVGQGRTVAEAREDAERHVTSTIEARPVHVYFIERAADHLIEH